MKKTLIVASLMLLVGCSTIGTLQQIVTVADIAVTTVAAIDPGVPGLALASTYLSAVLTGTNCAVMERQTSDNATVQDLKIAACYANALKPALPSGTPTTVVNVIDAVANAIANYLANLSAPSGAVRANAVVSGVNPKKFDGGSLGAMVTKLANARAKLGK